MSAAGRLAQQRLLRFRRGGVDLSRLDPEERDPLLAEVRIGLAPIKRGKFVFRCPTCGNRFESDQEMEPLCTGPNASLDEHEPAVMENLTLPGSSAGLDGATVLYERAVD